MLFIFVLDDFSTDSLTKLEAYYRVSTILLSLFMSADVG